MSAERDLLGILQGTCIVEEGLYIWRGASMSHKTLYVHGNGILQSGSLLQGCPLEQSSQGTWMSPLIRNGIGRVKGRAHIVRRQATK